MLFSIKSIKTNILLVLVYYKWLPTQKITWICSLFLNKWGILVDIFNFAINNNMGMLTLAWRIPWMEEPGRLQSMRSLRVGHDWVTSLWLFTFIHWRRKWQTTPVFLPGESQGRGSLLGCAVYGVAQSQTRLMRLSSSSSSTMWRIVEGEVLREPWGEQDLWEW